MFFRLQLLSPDGKARFSHPSAQTFYRDVNCEGLYVRTGYDNLIYGFFYKVYEDRIMSYPEGSELMIPSSTKVDILSMAYRGIAEQFSSSDLEWLTPEYDGDGNLVSEYWQTWHGWDWGCYEDVTREEWDASVAPEQMHSYPEDLTYGHNYLPGNSFWERKYPGATVTKLVPLKAADLPFTYPIKLPIRISSE